ncbi:hypothetical protein [Rheinheimera gaetbuli]
MQTRLISKVLRHIAAYWHGGLAPIGGIAAQNRRLPLLALVLSRRSYQEQQQRYPVTDLTALKKILANQTPADQVAIHIISPVQTRQRSVRSFFIDKSLTQQFPSVIFWLPESLLFGNTLQPQQAVEIAAADYSYYLARLNDDIASLPKSAHLPDISHFNHASGCPFIQVLPQQPAKAYQANLLQALNSVSDAVLWQCVLPPTAAVTAINWKPYAISGAAVLLGYHLLYSGYLLWQQQQLTTVPQDPLVSQLLQKVDTTEQLAQQVQQRIELQSQRVDSAVIWQLLADMAARGVEPQNIRFDASEITIRGNAIQVSQLLEWLKQQPYLSQIRLDAPLRTQAGKEVFVIKLALRQTSGVADAK